MCALALTDMATLVKVEGHRWAVEDGSETAKTELGLGHNETPSRHGWHRHVPLMMLAFARLAVLRRRAAEITSPPRKSCVGAAAALMRWSVREIRRVVAR